jgi:hypothetical protein
MPVPFFLFSRLAGYEDTNDAERLSVDSAMRYVVGGRACERQAASTSQMSRFETEVLTQAENLSALKKMPGIWNEHAEKRCRKKGTGIFSCGDAATLTVRPPCDSIPPTN